MISFLIYSSISACTIISVLLASHNKLKNKDDLISIYRLNSLGLISSDIRQAQPSLISINAGITLCTIIGLLGTFIGLSNGLSNINTDGDELIKGAKNLIGNMSFAFETSLWGVLASAFLTIYQPFAHWRVQENFNKIKSEIEKTEFTNIVTPIDMLVRIEGHIAQAQNREGSRDFAVAAEKMASSADLLARAARGFNLETLGTKIAQSLEYSVINHMKPPLEALAREVRDLRQSHENQREEMLRSLIDELNQQVFMPITGQISSLAGQLARSDETTQELIKAVRITSDDLTRVSETTQTTLEGMKSVQRSTMKDLAKYVSFLQNMLKSTSENLTQQREAFEISTQKSVEMLTQVREDTRQMFEVVTQDLARQAAEILLSARAELEDGLKALPEALRTMRTETEAQLTTFREEYQRRLQSFMEQQNQALRAQNASFEESANRSMALLTQVRDDSRAMLEEVTTRVVTNAVEVLSRARLEVEQGLRAVPEMLEKSRTETQAQLSEFREAYQGRLADFMRQQNQALEAQRLASEQTTRQSADLLTQARLEIEAGLRSVPEALSAVRVETQQQLTTFREEYQARLTEFMTQQSDILNGVLGEQREALAGIVRDLQVVFKEEYEQRKELGEQTTEHIKSVAESRDMLEKLSHMLGAQSATILPKIAEASQQVAEQMQSAYRQYQQLERTFSSSTAAFSSSSESFAEQVQRVFVGIQERQDQLFTKMDSELNTIFSHLVTVTQVLSLTTREIQSAQQALRYDQQRS